MGKVKKLVITLLGAFLLIGLCCIAFVLLNLGSVSKTSNEVNFTIAQGKSTKSVINDLYSAGIIKNKYVALFYVKTHPDIVIQAGDYVLNKNMSTPQILNELKKGIIKGNSYELKLIPGVSIKKYMEQIAAIYNWEYKDLDAKISDKEYLQTLIDKYWFIDQSILNDDLYFSLEGYIMPNTYEFSKDVTFDKIIDKLLNQTDKVLSKYKSDIEASKYSVHELLTVASIAEKEALDNKNDRVNGDRNKVTQVIYKRLDINMNLGMDVTSYYGVQKDMKKALSKADLNNVNSYNTRLASFIGLPVGPICNVSESSIIAALHPAKTDYVYFYADIKTGKVYFTDNYQEFLEFEKLYG